MGPFLSRAFLLLAASAAAAGAQEILHVRFSDDAAAPYDAAMAREDFGPTVQFAKVEAGRARIKEDADLKQKVLEVKYPKGCLGSGECAIQLRAHFPARDTAWLQYKVKFEPGFSWQRGGKLPGLCGGKCNTGCVGVSGKDGWSARMMWRGTGRLVQYMYIPGKSSDCGDDYDWNMSTIGTGTWHELRNQVVLNTPGKSDGWMRSWLDGKPVLDRKNVRFRDVAGIRIDQFYFSTFHGGSSDAWRPARDSYISFSDIMVSSVDPSGLMSGIRPEAAREGRALRAAWKGGRLHVAAGAGLGKVRVTVSDLRGAERASLDLPPSGEAWLPAHPGSGLSIISWTAGQRRGSFPVAAP